MAVRSPLRLKSLLTDNIYNSLIASQRGYRRGTYKLALELKKRQKQYYESLDQEKLAELTRRSKFSDWNYSAEIYAFGKRLHENFLPEVLVQAFTHRSYVVQKELKLKEVGVSSDESSALPDNTKLVSDGEEIITNFVPRYVSHFFPRFPLEGIIGVTDYLTSVDVLAHISENLGTKFLILSADYPVDPETFSQTLKAIVGALQECQGLQRANLFVRDFIVTQLAGKDINDYLTIANPLEVLNDIMKRDGREAVEPRLICQTSKNTILANYHVGLYSKKEMVGHCSGESIDIAIEMAAGDALKRLFGTTDSCSPITYDVEDVPETVANLPLSDWHSAAFDKKLAAKSVV